MSGTILIVDDEDEIRAVLTEYLEGQGYSVFEAPDLAQARRQLRTGLHPDLVILDVVLRDGDGISFLRELRSLTAPRDVPVIVVSAHRTSSRDKASGLEVGADDYVAKPFDLREIGFRIEKLVKPRRRAGKKGADSGDAESASREVENVSKLIQGMLARNVDVSELPAFPEVSRSSAPKKPDREPDEQDDTAESEEESVSAPGLGKLFLRLVVQPKVLLSQPPAAEFRLVAYGSILLSGVLAGIQEGVEAKLIATGFVHALMIPLAYSMATGIVAWITQWIMGLRRKPVKVKDVFIGLGAGFVPIVISAALGLVYVIAASGRAGDFTAGPLLWLPAQASSKFFGFFLRRLDIFEIWAVWLAALALHARIGGRLRSAYRFAFGLWFLIVVSGSLIHGFLS